MDTLLAQLTLRILLAAFLGGLIGLERSAGDRPAGLRTHVLVATGSALLMVISIYGSDGYTQTRDPSRIASQVVSGIGFLGAGTILHEGLTVKGLTTAASLWIVSAIGLTVGCGMLALGIFATVITLVTLILIRGLEKKVLPVGRSTKCVLHVAVNKNPDSMMEVMDYLQERNIKTRILGMRNDPQRNVLEVDLSV
ncbi:MAG: MgtC/SapB family protein, partial [Acidaminococcus sp.]|nr:MgtC/SapB family protein [Acidaminococcus sp.]